jgi:23S rRNA (cytosine1962-C5)-methyltransferase
MSNVGMFENRLRKNHRHLRRWAEREDVTAYRVYDRDIPEYPFVVEWYEGRAHVVEYPRRSARKEGLPTALRAQVLQAVQTVLEIPPEGIFTKTHLPMPWGERQYERLSTSGARFTVRERGLSFWVNLADYLDTGLFLDHRNTRQRVRGEAEGRRFLNLFAYTGAFTVYAAAGGAEHTTTVDLSNTYLAWAEENLALNRLGSKRHELLRADVLQWLRDAQGHDERYDLIVMDPPSFSASKKMAGSLNIQRDHIRLVEDARSLLAPHGVLYFSTNFTGFQLDAKRFPDAKELTPQSLPEDFRVKTIHRCWRLGAT